VAVAEIRRNTEVERKALSSGVELRVWVKAAGRCVLCATYLLDERTWHFHTTKVGEVAHIVGASSGSKSPRGSSPLDEKARAAEPNLMLLCHACHRMVDDLQNVEIWTEGVLSQRKEEHEARVRRVTDFSTLQRTLVVTTESTVRSERVTVGSRQITQALVEEGLTAHMDGGLRSDICVKLPEALDDPSDWAYAVKTIEAQVRRIRKSIELGADADLSVFALAPIPLLVHLGSLLDDTTTVRVFDRHRDDHEARAWMWRTRREGPPVKFDLDVPREASATELVIEVAVSGTARVGRLAEDVEPLPRARMAVSGQDARAGVLATRADLDAASAAWTRSLALVEERCPNVQTLHVVASVPASLAVSMGRARMRGAHPAFVVYQLANGTYMPTTMITDPAE
jgi:hypothetical protein